MSGRLSGWCSPSQGMTHAYQHEICGRRGEDCDCTEYSGHPKAENQSQLGDFEGTGTVESEAQSGPESVGADRGQADWLGVDNG